MNPFQTPVQYFFINIIIGMTGIAFSGQQAVLFNGCYNIIFLQCPSNAVDGGL